MYFLPTSKSRVRAAEIMPRSVQRLNATLFDSDEFTDLGLTCGHHDSRYWPGWRRPAVRKLANNFLKGQGRHWPNLSLFVRLVPILVLLSLLHLGANYTIIFNSEIFLKFVLLEKTQNMNFLKKCLKSWT